MICPALVKHIASPDDNHEYYTRAFLAAADLPHANLNRSLSIQHDCDKVCQCNSTVLWSLISTLVSFAYNPHRHHITEMFLIMVLRVDYIFFFLPITTKFVMLNSAYADVISVSDLRQVSPINKTEAKEAR